MRSEGWCRRRDLNPHGFPHRPSKVVAPRDALGADPGRVFAGALPFLDDADHRIRITFAVRTLGDEDSNITADERGAAGFVVDPRASWDALYPRADPVGARQPHQALDLPGAGNILIPDRMQETAVVVGGRLVEVSSPAARYVFDDTRILEDTGVIPFQYALSRIRPAYLPEHPIGGGIVRMLDRHLHMPATLITVNQLALLGLVEESRCNEELHHAGRFKLVVLVDADQFFGVCEIVREPHVCRGRVGASFRTHTADVVFDGRLEGQDLATAFGVRPSLSGRTRKVGPGGRQ